MSGFAALRDTTALVAVTLLTMSAAAVASTNLVQNPGFETGDFTDWTASTDMNIIGVLQHSGSFDAEILALPSSSCHVDCPLSQNITTISGRTYTLGFFVYPSAIHSDTFSASWNGTNVFSTTVAGSGYIGETIGNLKATGTSTPLVFDLTLNGGSQAFLDDISVTLNPLPNVAPGNLGAFNVLQGISGTTDPVLSQIETNLNNATTSGAANNILSATNPTVDGSDYTGSVNVSDNTLNLTGARLTDLRMGENNSTGMAAGNMGKGLAAWGQAFGQHTNQGERDGIAGYHANTWGGALGLDTRNVSDRAILGLGFSYGRTNASSSNANTTDTNVDSYQVTLYGNWDLTQGMYLNGMAGYGWNSMSRTRHDVGGISGVDAQGNYNARQISAQAEAGKDIGFHGMTLTTNVMSHRVNFHTDSYTETGAGGGDLHVAGNTMNLFELGGGVKAGWTFKNTDGSQIKPQLNIGYRYALTDDQISDTGSFTGGGGAFTVTGPTPARSSVDLGASVKFLTTANWEFTASYDFDWRDNYTANAGFLRATYKF